MVPIEFTKLCKILIFSLFCTLPHISATRSHGFRYQGGNFPIISHLRPDTQNSHLAWIFWSFERSPRAYERFELYRCKHDATHVDTNLVPSTERLAVIPNGQFEAVIKNMPETNRPCVIVCAILRESLASCSNKFACFNKKYTIPSGSMRLMTPNIAPIMLEARRDFDRLRISWNFPFKDVKITSYLIDLNYGTDQSYQSIDEVLHTTEIVHQTDTSVNMRLDGSQIESEKFLFVRVCSIERLNHRERKNCSEQLVLPLSEVEEDLQEDNAVEITGIRPHIHSANIILSEPLENRNTSELHVMCIADHETVRSDGNSARVLEWRTSNMLGNILNLEGLNPGTRYRCNIQAKPTSNSIAYTIYAKKEFTFRSKSIEIENPPIPKISGTKYVLEGKIVKHPFSVQLEATTPQVEISSYLLVAWPQHTSIPTQLYSNSVNTMSEATTKGKSVPFIQEIIQPEMLPIEYMFDFVVDKTAYKQDECYYFLIAAVTFETNNSYPFSTSNKCVSFTYNEDKVTGMSSKVKKIGMISVVLITLGMIVTILVIMVLVTWKMRLWLNLSKEDKLIEDDGKDGVDKVFKLLDKVTGKGQYREDDVKAVLLNTPKIELPAESDSSLPEITPLINQEYNNISSD